MLARDVAPPSVQLRWNGNTIHKPGPGTYERDLEGVWGNGAGVTDLDRTLGFSSHDVYEVQDPHGSCVTTQPEQKERNEGVRGWLDA